MNGSRRLHLGASSLLKLWGKILSESLRTWEGLREKRIINNLYEPLWARHCAKNLIFTTTLQCYHSYYLHLTDEKTEAYRG